MSRFQKSDLPVTETAFVYFASGQIPQIEESTLPASKNEVLSAFVSYFIEQPEAFYQIAGLISFSDTTFKDSVLMYLAVMAANLLLIENFVVGYCFRMTADAPGIYVMLLWQMMTDTGILCEIPKCHTYLNAL